MIRHFASAIVMVAIAACTATPAAHATKFLAAIEDVPLPAGLVEQPEPLVFESDQGRVVRTSAAGNVGKAEIEAFYGQTLPALGWKLAEDGGYVRDNERLKLRILQPASMTPVRVDFELVVKLASTRLPD